jgi:CrcB protein
LVAAGGAAGSLARWRVGLDVDGALAILLVNVTGSLLLGYLVGRVPVRGPRSEALRLGLGTGVLGGWTTFSAYAVHAARMLDAAPVAATLWAAVVALLSVGAAGVGYTVGSITEATRGGGEG